MNAAKEKGGLKQHKDKLEVTKQTGGGPKTVNNNLIVDRNELIKELMGQEKIKEIENETE